ncbi:hypothetical protein C0Q70_17953 [Pomacea canaliculata]|uniref:Uncharacterized protein n=1 Tax=Pomacea canaliculata TaxID=400727 RepID=A0A2T7NLW0_POMCA|nr:hypothetical protein C0Q70_17953 [Pomacea canaliculata]
MVIKNGAQLPHLAALPSRALDGTREREKKDRDKIKGKKEADDDDDDDDLRRGSRDTREESEVMMSILQLLPSTLQSQMVCRGSRGDPPLLLLKDDDVNYRHHEDMWL